ncbi:hypothetical protein [Nocardioides ungokensis]|uniref:hypothetical protein n=1 Tax=Nocardioides ungokensis TaxID=1643322 RepID=UPI0015DE5C77|nr:hypothetical protein [Nocardioides ungokensis]
MDETVAVDGRPIGYDPATDPEEHGDLLGPLDGSIDPVSGHGTFIAGMVHQACPDADILSWRVVRPRGRWSSRTGSPPSRRSSSWSSRHAEGRPGGRRSTSSASRWATTTRPRGRPVRSDAA